ncbi:hypothetical protein U716_02355 [Rhodobacter capsulatus B6]|nr:hypothetical protein U716_02355 [Rhodobacter capsulatus B6]
MLVVIEDKTGAGKTEAALTLAHGRAARRSAISPPIRARSRGRSRFPGSRRSRRRSIIW